MEGYMILDFKAFSGILLLFSLGLALTVVGYLIKGIWGASIALGSGVLLFLYFNGLLPF
jgi:hypothetical protein